MARKHKHEDHVNHEAWAIPYGDLLTLLLAFFVVMYAVSSVNEGRYRVLADSLSQAFGGPPKSLKPVQIGDKPQKGTQADAMFNTPSMRGFEKEVSQLQAGRAGVRIGGEQPSPRSEGEQSKAALDAPPQALKTMSDAVQAAMKDLITAKLVTVRRNEHWLEIEIRTDILFASGVAQIAPSAEPVLQKLADILKPFPNPLRIEGYTDNVPIATNRFPSNWELSAARAASVVHLFMETGVDPTRMSVAGFGEYRPVADNADADGRNRNRRVVVVVMANEGDQVMASTDPAVAPPQADGGGSLAAPAESAAPAAPVAAVASLAGAHGLASRAAATGLP
ncbi:flagellar motor protein MotD [Solimonas terrae]|uniref:Flagellar motor protein MotD n=1 Tax=Solimonas terrae TaxID=1396819 RepID=A0A6M2BWX8_9GAMM|nr:flagellar motor protein MotD [Solimonas terrae]NGY06894.1 flagellar motor protein MotD [Solimonas terrae]